MGNTGSKSRPATHNAGQTLTGKNRNGFTLVEVMIAVVVVGIGVAASLFGMGTSVINADAGRDVLVAGILSDYIWQYSEELEFWDPQENENFGIETDENGFDDYDDIDDLHGQVISPPVGADGEILTSFPNWTQEITVAGLDPVSFLALVNPGVTPVRRVRVTILKADREVESYEWIVTRL